jgi:hypothetical protein
LDPFETTLSTILAFISVSGYKSQDLVTYTSIRPTAMAETTTFTAPLSQGFGYGIIVGLGFAFALLMIFITWALKRWVPILHFNQ